MTISIDMTVTPWILEIPASSMPHGYFQQPYSWQLPIQHGSNGLVDVTATGLPPGLTVSPTGLVSGTPGTGEDFPRDVHRDRSSGRRTLGDAEVGHLDAEHLVALAPAAACPPPT